MFTFLVVVMCIAGQECHGHEVATWYGDYLEQCEEEIVRHELGYSAYCELDLSGDQA